MKRRTSPTRTALPLALMGLAVAMPLSTSGRVALAATREPAIRLAEPTRQSWSGHLAAAAKRFCGSQQPVALTPTLPARLAVLVLAPCAIRPADRSVHLNLSARLPMLLNRPPPVGG